MDIYIIIFRVYHFFKKTKKRRIVKTMLYVVISAMLFGVTFFIPELSIVTMTIFLIPLHKRQNNSLWLQGLFWGLIVFGSFWYWIVILFKNQSLIYIGILLWLLATLWCCLLCITWLYFFKKHPTISTTALFLFLIKGVMLPLGILEGMPFLNPFVLLSKYSLLIKPLYYISDAGMFLILFGVQNWIALQKKGIQGIYFALISIIIVLLVLGRDKDQNYTIDGAITIIPWWYNQKKGAMFDGYRLAHDLSIRNTYSTKIIITPESTFCFDIHGYPEFIKIWCESAENTPIILGTHITLGQNTHNAIVVLHNNKIEHCYLKQHAMPFIERNVWFERICAKPLLLSDLMSHPKNIPMHNDLIYISGKIYQIFLCSELFTESKKVWGYPVLFLWNDYWLSANYMKRLAKLFINYFENKYHVDIYYISTSGESNF